MLKSAAPADHIPFVNSEADCQILHANYADAYAVRLPLLNAERLRARIPPGLQRWIDPELDGLHHWNIAAPEYTRYIKTFAHHQQILDESFQKKPQRAVVREFVNAVLDACLIVQPAWITVPQLPIVTDVARNKLNRELAEATGEWATDNRFSGMLVLPAIFTHQAQLNLKTARTPKVAVVAQCYALSGAKGLWVVDSSLMDQDGSRTLEQTRFPGVINMHEELRQAIPEAVVIGGPYWGLNLVLWSKGLIGHPGVGLGNRYQYHLSGGRLLAGKARIALDCLKRLVIVDADLQVWLGAAIKTVAPTDPAHFEFTTLLSRFATLLHGSTNRDQIARTYKRWYDSLAAVPLPGRALALYQQFSSAYVLGKSLPDLPGKGTARRPERIAQQLMLACL
jgi:hypothetical protein